MPIDIDQLMKMGLISSDAKNKVLDPLEGLPLHQRQTGLLPPVGAGLSAQAPRIASSPKMQEALLRNNWLRHGRDMDYEDIPRWDSVWAKEARDWNKTAGHHDQVPPTGDYKFGSVPAFEKQFEQKYLEGKKAPFPGVKQANEYFSDGGEIQHSVYLHPDEAPY